MQTIEVWVTYDEQPTLVERHIYHADHDEDAINRLLTRHKRLAKKDYFDPVTVILTTE